VSKTDRPGLVLPLQGDLCEVVLPFRPREGHLALDDFRSRLLAAHRGVPPRHDRDDPAEDSPDHVPGQGQSQRGHQQRSHEDEQSPELSPLPCGGLVARHEGLAVASGDGDVEHFPVVLGPDDVDRLVVVPRLNDVDRLVVVPRFVLGHRPHSEVRERMRSVPSAGV
jgi:hypothetical protein